jgi:hypothetical protein
MEEEEEKEKGKKEEKKSPWGMRVSPGLNH